MTVCLNTEDLEIFPRQWLEGEGAGDSLILIVGSGVRLSYACFLVDNILVLSRILPRIQYLCHFTAGSKKRNLFLICVNLGEKNNEVSYHNGTPFLSFTKQGWEMLLFEGSTECPLAFKNKTKTEQNKNFSRRLSSGWNSYHGHSNVKSSVKL